MTRKPRSSCSLLLGLVFAVLYAVPLQLTAQREIDLWTSSTLQVPIRKAWKIGFTSEVRMSQYQVPSTFFQEASASYEFWTRWKVSVDYRLVHKANLFNNFPTSHRINFNAQVKQKFDWGSIHFRGRFQTGFSQQQLSSNYSPEFDNALRLRPGIEFKYSKKVKPYVQAEWFYNLENKALGHRFTRTRFAFGTEFNLKGPHDIDVKYVFGFSTNIPVWTREHILSVSYSYEWKKDKKARKIWKKNPTSPIFLFADYPISAG